MNAGLNLLAKGSVTGICSVGLTYAETKINAAAGASPLDETFDSATKGLLPIPQTEITLSGNKLKQNAGY